MSRGQCIAQEIQCIRTTLAQQGVGEASAGTYRLQKLPGQAVWVIHLGNGTSYRLTYQPTPIDAWAIHPPGGEASRLLGIIDRALANLTAGNGRRNG